MRIPVKPLEREVLYARFVGISYLVQFFRMSNSYIQMLRQRIADVVVIAGRLNCGLCASVPLGELVKVRVLRR
jgi:hypothetical protein